MQDENQPSAAEAAGAGSKSCLAACCTEYGDDLVVLDDFQGARDHEAESVDALPNVEDEVAGGAVSGLKLHGQGAQAAVAGQAEGRVVVEDLPVEVDADVRPHVFGTNGEDLSGEGDLRTSLASAASAGLADATLSVSMPLDMAQVETTKSMTLSLRPSGTW